MCQIMCRNRAHAAASRTRRFALRLLPILAVALPATACDVFQPGTETPDQARVVVSGSTPLPLRLITSTRFTRTTDEDGSTVTTFTDADTVYLDVDIDFDRVYPVKPDNRFLARLTNPEAEDATVSMRVYFDGDLEYDQENVTLRDASLEFSYVFSSY